MPARKALVWLVTPAEMANECKRVLERDQFFVSFVVPRRPRGAGRMKLAGGKSPLGEVICVNTDGHSVCRFDVIEVLAWLAAHGAVRVGMELSGVSGSKQT